MSSKQGYRPDIDGLRAVAVLSVLLFHLRGSLLPGGFVGVDIFFVISGYLISMHIFAAVDAGSFSYRDFYQRRINRILPAFYGLIVFTALLTVLFFLPADVYAVAQSAINALKFKVNYYFARDYDYFRPSTAELPLLNLWSLSVEEQFYLILPPLALVVFSRLSARVRSAALGVLILASVAFAEYELAHGLAQDAYYSTLTRASELLVGSFLASLSFTASPNAREVMSGLGAAAILFSFFGFSAHTAFPGLNSLIPTVGAALLIAGEDTWLMRKLAWRPVVFFGLISYSLYLYHWPVLGMGRYILGVNDFSAALLVLLALVSIALGTLSWKFIESPFRRNPSTFKRVFVLRFLVPSVLAIAVLSWLAGFESNLSGARADLIHRSLHFLSDKYCHGHFEEPGCTFGDLTKPADILLIGDSTAGHFQPVLDEVGKKQGFAFVARSVGACHAFVQIPGDPPQLKLNSDCLLQVQWSETVISRFKTFVVSADWYGIKGADQSDAYYSYLARSIEYLKAHGKRVILLEQIPESPGVLKFFREKFALAGFLFDTDAVYREVLASSGSVTNESNAFVRKFAAEHGAAYVELASRFQKTHTLPFSGDEYYYKDNRHLNEFGGLTMGRALGEKYPELGREIAGP